MVMSRRYASHWNAFLLFARFESTWSLDLGRGTMDFGTPLAVLG